MDGVTVGCYVDSTTTYSVSKTKDLVIKETDHFSEFLFQLFTVNYMKINSSKRHMLFRENDVVSVHIDNNAITEWTIRYSFALNTFLKIIQIASVKKKKLKTQWISKNCPYICLEKRKIVMKAFVTSQFGYCLLVWMFHNGVVNNKINFWHEGALRIT